jgi:hypothetical protein
MVLSVEKLLAVLKRPAVGRWLWAIGIGLVGIGLITAGFLNETAARPKLRSIILIEMGIAALIAAIAEFALLEDASQQMGREVNGLLQKVRQDYDVVTHALENGLVDVLPPRRVKQVAAWRDITSAIQQARGDVWICGICLKEFLDGQNPINRILRELLINDEKINFKLLLLDPFTQAARMRSTAEQGADVVYEEGQLFTDIVGSMASIRALYREADRKKQFKIEARFCNVMPPAYVIGSPDSLFLEVYHFGRGATDGPCIGGFVPLLRFNNSCDMYRRVAEHFKYMWNSVKVANDAQPVRCDGEILRVRTLDELEQELRRQRGQLEVASRACTTSDCNGQHKVGTPA